MVGLADVDFLFLLSDDELIAVFHQVGIFTPEELERRERSVRTTRLQQQAFFPSPEEQRRLQQQQLGAQGSLGMSGPFGVLGALGSFGGAFGPLGLGGFR